LNPTWKGQTPLYTSGLSGGALLARDSSSIQRYPVFGGVGFKPPDPSFWPGGNSL